ncbi:MAG: hypothetical protein II699_03100 [Lachnospiraceae bacterium]|nr:hypothetical protein [Lachnospiraceae bacterium]
MGDPKIKKDEQKTLMELLDDTIFELTGVLGSLKSQLSSETRYTEGEQVESSPVVINIHKEIGMVERQLNYIKTTKEHCIILLQEIEDEKKRKEMEETLKGVLIVGAINEFVRKKIAMEEEEKEHFMTFEYDYKAEEKHVVDELFKRKVYKYVTKEDVEAIKQDKELNEMVKEDPYKLEKEALFHKDRYERMMEQYMIECSFKNYGETFEEKERNFIGLLKIPNEFEKAKETIEKEVEHDKEVISKTLTPEELETFDTICDEIKDLAKITRRRQQEFVTGKSSFKKGNGYTEKLIKREKDLCQKISAFKAQLEAKSMKLLADMDMTDPDMIYVRDHMVAPLTYVSMFDSPIKNQSKRDACFLESRGVRIREERWDVYKNIPSKRNLVRAATRRVSRAESIALAKGERFEQRSEGKGTNIQALASLANAASKAINYFHNINKGGEMPPSDMHMVKDSMATIILFQVLSDEERVFGRGVPTPNRDALCENGFFVKNYTDEFVDMARNFAQTKAFDKAINKIKGKNFEEKVVQFLTTDIEKDIAKKFVGKPVLGGPEASLDVSSMDRSSSISI